MRLDFSRLGFTHPYRVVALAVVAVTLCASFSYAGTSRRQLDTTLPELRFDGVAFGDAIDFIRDVSGANINVNWKALEEAGVSKDAPLNIRLRSISLNKALSLMLSQVGGGATLGYTLDQGVIEVTTQDKIDAIVYTRVYPIEDLIMEIPDFDDAPNFDLNSTSGNGSSSGSNGGGGNNQKLFPDAATDQSKEKGKTKTERAEDLIALIKELVQPDVWENGKAGIRYFNGNLVVTAPRSVQEAIGGRFD